MFAVKRALELNNSEATLMSKHAGFRRVVYNMGLSLRTQMYSEAKCSDSKVIDAAREGFNQLRKEAP